MSIWDEIDRRVAEGRLFPILPALPSGRAGRHLYGAEEIIRLIEGPWPDIREEIRAGRLRQDFDRFIERKRINLALDNPYRKDKTAYLARLDPARDEV